MLAGGGLHNAIFGLTKEVNCTLSEQIEAKRQAGNAISENAVVNIATGGEVAGKRRGAFPHLSPATCVLVVAIRESLPACEREPLRQEDQ